jgi:anaerobic magnesium-protoporphyrin IX monomethyl ester cyclase
MSHSVVLVAPPNPSMLEPRIAPPLGLLSLVAYARQQGRDTTDWRVIDLNVECYAPEAPRGHATHDFSLARCMAEIPTGADVYGLSFASMQYPHAVAIAAELAERDPQALLVCGGSHPSAVGKEVLTTSAFEAAVVGEGETAFLDILEDKYQAIDTMFHGRQIKDLNALPFPARDLVDFSKYVRKIGGQPATNMITSRGCPAKCIFCQQESLWGKGLRMQSASRIIAEVDNIYETTEIRNILFLDDSLTARPRRDLVELCARLKGRGVLWRGWTRANLCTRKGDPDMLHMMADSGCQALCIGVEAGTDKVLQALQKGTTVEINRQAIRNVAESGMSCRASIMVGNPSETWEDVVALRDFVEEMSPWLDDWLLSSYVPLPGTPSWDDPEKHGMRIDKAKAKATHYQHFFVVGGHEQSGTVHELLDGTGPDDIQLRHDFVLESLLRLAPRDRVKVTIGRRGNGSGNLRHPAPGQPATT